MTLRVATYNIRGARHADGSLGIRHVADLAQELDADCLALQEVDVLLTRSRRVNQAAFIANRLDMDHWFVPTLADEGGRYGHALLSRYPLQDVLVETLPAARWLGGEPRKALRAEVCVGGRSVRLVTTHLSFLPHDNAHQTRALTEPPWLLGDESHATVLLGDLNTWPGRRSFGVLARTLGGAPPHWRVAPTWPAWRPLLRLDHILVRGPARIVRSDVVDSPIARACSDHLPVVAEVRLDEARVRQTRDDVTSCLT